MLSQRVLFINRPISPALIAHHKVFTMKTTVNVLDTFTKSSKHAILLLNSKVLCYFPFSTSNAKKQIIKPTVFS